VQNRCNLTDRTSQRLLDVSTAEGIGLIPWAPVAAGGLAKPGGPLGEIARATGGTAGQVALARLLPASPVMLKVPGAGSVDHREENAAAATVTLTDARVAELTAAG
jgi:pyridoxine 4-dehydrogenase